MSRMRFRSTLLRVSDQLSNHDLDNLKYISRTVIPNARMDKIRSGLDLLNALEERGKLSPGNVDFLYTILTTAGCQNSIKILQTDGFNSTGQTPNDRVYHFHECLLKLALGLNSSEFDSLKFYLAPILKQSMDRVYTITELFQLLQQRRIVTETDLKVLYEAMIDLGRRDLSDDVINRYMLSVGYEPYQFHPQGQTSMYVQPPMGRTTTAPLNHPVEATPDDHTDRQLQAIGSGMRSNQSPFSPSIASQSGSMQSSVGSGQSMSTLGSSMPSRMGSGESMSIGSTMPSRMESGQSISSMGSSMEYGQSGLHQSPSGVSLGNDGKIIHNPPIQYPQGSNVVVHGNPNPLPYNSAQFYQHQSPNGDTSKNPYGFTFDPALENAQLSQNERLHKELAQKEEMLGDREVRIDQFQVEIEKLRTQVGSVTSQHKDKEVGYVQKIRELEGLLRQVTQEADSYRLQIQEGHDQLQKVSPSSNQADEDFYQMRSSPHGICLIINNYQFHHPDPNKCHQERGGANVDLHNLAKTFKYLRYKVEVCENLTSVQMSETMLKMGTRDHSQYDSFICCILTHGEQDVVHGSDCEPVNLNDLAGVMKMCSTLRGKPKLFFIQACRGEQEDEGFHLKDIQRDAGGGPYANTIPRESDFYFGFATPTGNSAYRSRRYGSWFISELCQVFVNHAYTHDLHAMMVKVNNKVSNAYTKDGYKQSPESVGRLRFQVHFFRFLQSREASGRAYQ